MAKSYNRRSMNNEQIHDLYLNKLCNSSNLERIGEEPRHVAWIMRDGIWQPDCSTKRLSLCDLILTYYDGSASAIELKGSRNKRQKAAQQVYAGRDFITNVLEYDVRNLTIVYYRPNGYQWEHL